MNFTISPQHRSERLTKDYAQHKRLQIPDFLPKDVAAELYTCLRKNISWDLVYQNNKLAKAEVLSQEEFLKSDMQAQNNLQLKIYQEAQNNFQFIYHTYPILDRYLENNPYLPELLRHYLDWINSPKYLDFFREISGHHSIIKADAQATRYGPNQFLNKHNDIPRGEKRLIAYVLNLTPTWDPNWGGYLQFYSDNNNIEAAFIPSFNTLNIFSVPYEHGVSFVTPFAGAYRYSITGWFRED